MNDTVAFHPSAQVVQLLAGETLFQTGDRGGRMFVVLEGEVNLYRGTTLLETACPGSIFGELSLIENLPRSATAIARTPCVLQSIDAAQFEHLIQETPHFALHVMRTLAARLRRADASPSDVDVKTTEKGESVPGPR